MSFKWVCPSGFSKFDLEDVRNIVSKATRVLNTVQWTIEGTDEFMDSLVAFGCKVNGNKVIFTEKAIEDTLCRMKYISSSKKATESYDVPEEIWAVTHGEALWYSDPINDKLRPACVEDLGKWCRLVNSFENTKRSHSTLMPQDVPLHTRDLHAFVTVMLNSDRPYHMDVFSKKILKYWIEAVKVYYENEEKSTEMLYQLNPTHIYIYTPFKIPREGVETAMEFRRLTGAPIQVGTMPSVGTSTPITLPAALIIMTAEVIASNIITLAIDDRIIGWNSNPVIFDMKYGVANAWGPDLVVLKTAATHVSSYLFGSKPRFVGTSLTGATVPGAQSMAERAFGFGMDYLAGYRSFGVGCLGYADVGSPVQLALDMELISAMRAMAQGFDVNEELLAEQLITKTCPNGAEFLNTEHTFKYHRSSQWHPEFMVSRSVGSSAKNEDPKTMVDLARKKVIAMIDTAPNLCPLNESRRHELRMLLEFADKELG